MKWGRKKPLASSSTSSSSVVARVFPVSWLSKFKPAKSEPVVAISPKLKIRQKQNLILNLKNESFYGGGDGDDDGFWRLSFGEDGVERGKGGDLFKAERFDQENELAILHREDNKLFSNMVADIRKIRQVPTNIEVLPNLKEPEFIRQREKVSKPRKTQQKDLLELKPVLTIRTSERKKPEFVNSCSRKVSDDYDTKPRNCNEEHVREEDLQNNRRSLYISRELPRSKTNRRVSKGVNVQSPRTPFKVEVCKIKAIQDMKRAKMRTQKKIKDDERRRFESFAVVKDSFNVHQDFRDSMVEMIIEKGISQPGELEDLLACYLTLNSDDCHELIIKVFRQVWFDLHHAYDPNKLLMKMN